MQQQQQQRHEACRAPRRQRHLQVLQRLLRRRRRRLLLLLGRRPATRSSEPCVFATTGCFCSAKLPKLHGILWETEGKGLVIFIGSY
jgi:hypothetical protein